MRFGSYKELCEIAPLTICPLVHNGVEPLCYARSLSLGTTLVFEAATILIYFISLIMTSIMVYSIKSKYTAVGRKEMVLFFYIFFFQVIVEFLITSNLVPISSNAYPYFTAFHVGLISSLCWCLFVNGFISFQFIEDGTPFSLWLIRLSSLGIFLVTVFISLATFFNLSGFSSNSPTILFAIQFVFNGLLLLVYFLMQLVLIFKNLDDLWPLGDLVLSFVFFMMGQLTLLVLSKSICDKARHYFDGLFFESILTLLAIMMIYKYWDSITKEDLEFSVGGKPNVWEVKDKDFP